MDLKRIGLYAVMIAGGLGILFNLFQIIIIISGKYNRNPNIESPILVVLDSIALTALWLVISIVVTGGALMMLRRT